MPFLSVWVFFLTKQSRMPQQNVALGVASQKLPVYIGLYVAKLE